MKTYSLSWDIIALADAVEASTAPTDNYQFFKTHFGGNAISLFFDRNGQSRGAKPRGWSAAIRVKAKDADGGVHTLEVDYKPDRKMFLKEFMQGITKHWVDECDMEFPDMDCISATAVARCKAT